jgi:predicted transcriptional regulator
MTLNGVPMTLKEQNQDILDARDKVARLLLDHVGDAGNARNRLAQRDIAAKLGMGWGMVHLSLKSLYRDGFIKIDRNRIVLNRELIRKMAAVV